MVSTLLSIVSKNRLLLISKFSIDSARNPENPVNEVSDIIILSIPLISLLKWTLLKIGKIFQCNVLTHFKAGNDINANEVNSIILNVPLINSIIGASILTVSGLFKIVKLPNNFSKFENVIIG